jgi:MtN3 and saliva related transmembrane protein
MGDARRATPVTPELTMTLPDMIGYLAATLTTASFVPQALLTLRTRNVSGISLSMYSVFTVGVALWLVYGITLGELPIVIANALTLALAATILTMKILVEREQRQNRQKR